MKNVVLKKRWSAQDRAQLVLLSMAIVENRLPTYICSWLLK